MRKREWRPDMLQNRLKQFGYTKTKVLEGGTTFNQLEKNKKHRRKSKCQH